MADIGINCEHIVKGRLSVSRTLDTSDNPPRLIISGTLVTHRYFDEITDIDTNRYELEGVSVFRESFGSDDYNIIYEFVAKKLNIKGGETNLTEDEIKKIEKDLYKNDGVFGGVEDDRRS